MKMKDEAVALTGNVINWTLTITQTKETFEIVQIITSIIVSLLTAGFIIWKWYKNANKDGKIETHEVKDLAEDLKDEFQNKGGKRND